MLPRLKPREFYDLVIEVAIVRPGPIQGDMVHPYLRRRDRIEKEEYPNEELRPVLSRTKGVPLFQEQAMEIAMVAAEFTAAEADQLRRSMASFKSKIGEVRKFKEKLTTQMVARGYELPYAERIFKQLEGFGSYGFPESHAASFAHLVYISSWIKCFFPDVFAESLLNSQPMGFYQPAQIVIDAQKHGVVVRPVDVNLSMWDNTLEEKDGKYRALRLGFRQVKGLNEDDMEKLIKARGEGYTGIHQLSDAGVPQFAIERLTDADAFRSMNLDRRQALWEVPALSDKPIGLFAGQQSESAAEGQISLPFMSPAEHVVQDYAVTGLSLKAHPVSFVRRELDLLRVTPNGDLPKLKDGDPVKVAGLITVRQRPGTAKGIVFITIEDETGFSNLVVWERAFATFRREILQARLLMVEGKVQIEGQVIHVIVKRCHNLNKLLSAITKHHDQNVPVITLSNHKEDPAAPPIDIKRKQWQNEPFYKGRNFK